jgi:acyl-CoA synthetase (NDP forming)
LIGTETGLRAIKRLFDYAEFQRELQENKKQSSNLTLDNLPSKDKIAEIRKQLNSADSALSEVESKQILSEYGIGVSTEQIANSLDQALEVADEIGFPVVLKTAAGAANKTEVSGKFEFGQPRRADFCLQRSGVQTRDSCGCPGNGYRRSGIIAWGN